jgi:hypothetical protein
MNESELVARLRLSDFVMYHKAATVRFLFIQQPRNMYPYQVLQCYVPVSTKKWHVILADGTRNLELHEAAPNSLLHATILAV